MSVNGRAALRDVEDRTLAEHGYLELKRRTVWLALPPGSTSRDDIDRLETLNLCLWNMCFDSHAVFRADLFVHEPIVETPAGRDTLAADAAMREHITSSKEQLLAGLPGEGALYSLILGKEGHRA
jgi:hypothetical protein